MIYFRDLANRNEYIQISGHLAASLRRNKLSYDQINNEATLRSLNIEVGVKLETVQVMLYKDNFVEYLDGYNKHSKRELIALISSVVCVILFSILYSITTRKIY